MCRDFLDPVTKTIFTPDRERIHLSRIEYKDAQYCDACTDPKLANADPCVVTCQPRKTMCARRLLHFMESHGMRYVYALYTHE